MFAPDPRRMPTEGLRISHPPGFADTQDLLGQMLAVVRPASTVFLLRAPGGAPSAEIASAAQLALGRSCPDPAEINLLPAGSESFALVLTPHSDRALDPVAVHAILMAFRRNLAAALPHIYDAGDETVILPIAPVASISGLQDNLAALNELLDALLQRKFNVHFQPIVHLPTGKVFGYEALIRVPQTGVLKKPGMFFRAADKARLVSWMDVNCQERCFEEAAKAGVRDYLFANMDAEGLSHLQMSGYDLVAQARIHGISPMQVVLEITERQAVEDFPRLAPFIEELRNSGFKIAVDDAGAGYSSLHTIAELKPDFVKIDRSLVRTLQDSGPRRALLSTLTRFASQVGAAVIAEGCETRDELGAVIECGVTYGQGYILARPDEKFKGVRKEVQDFVSDRMAHRARRVMGDTYAIERMARRGVTLPPEAPGSDAAQKFRKFPDMESIAVVTPEGRVEGLLTRTKWESCGGVQQPETPISHWMDRRPLVVEASTPLEGTAAQATYRPGAQFQDDLVIARGGEYVGVVPMRALLDAVVTRKVNQPRYEHPVTGLPSMAPLELECNSRLSEGRPVALALVEIAYFRPFNQHFGMAAGDDLLRTTASLLKDSSGPEALTAHLHGNDFMLMLEPEELESTCQRLVERFPVAAHAAYCAIERKQGYLETIDPAGQSRRIPLVALRIYGIDSRSTPFPTFSQGYRLAATLRQSARRAGLPANESAFRIE